MFKKFLFITLCSLVFVQAVRGQSDTFFTAVKCFNINEPEKAKSLFLKELKDNPDNDAACYYLAMIFDAQGDLASEEVYLSEALRLSPENYFYNFYMAMFYERTGRPEIASAILEEMIAKYPGKSEIYLDAISSYMMQGDVENALATLDKIEEKKGKNEVFCRTRLDLLTKKKDVSGEQIRDCLLDYYKECKTPVIATMLGDYYAKSYKDSIALSYYSQSLEMSPDYVPALIGQAHVFQSLRQYDKFFENIDLFVSNPDTDPQIKAEYLKAIVESGDFIMAFPKEIDALILDAYEANPTDSAVGSVVGLYYYRTSRPYLAMEVLRQNMENHPQSPELANEYLAVLYYSQAWALLETTATTVLNRFGESVNNLQLRAIALWQQDKTDESIADYKRIEVIGGRDTSVALMVFSSLGDIYNQKGDTKSSFYYYKKALKIDPDNVGILNNYAYNLCLTGKDLKKAKTMSRKTIEKEPDNATYLDTYAWILHLMGDDLEAKAFFKHAMLYGGKENAVILDHYAEVLYILKEYQLAYIYWNQADSMDSSLGIREKIRQRKEQQKSAK